MAGYDLSGVGRISQTTNEYYVIMNYGAVVLYFNQFRGWLDPVPPAQSLQSPISITIHKLNGSDRKVGQIGPSDTIIFSFPTATTNDNDVVALSEPPSQP